MGKESGGKESKERKGKRREGRRKRRGKEKKGKKEAEREAPQFTFLVTPMAAGAANGWHDSMHGTSRSHVHEIVLLIGDTRRQKHVAVDVRENLW